MSLLVHCSFKCANQVLGCKAADHSIESLFGSPDTEAVIWLMPQMLLVPLIVMLPCITFNIFVHHISL